MTYYVVVSVRDGRTEETYGPFQTEREANEARDRIVNRPAWIEERRQNG